MSIEREVEGKILVPEYLPEGVHFLDQPPYSWINENFWKGRFSFTNEERRSLVRQITGVAAIGEAKFDLDRRISTYTQLRKEFAIKENKVLSELIYSIYHYLNNYPFSGSYVKEKKIECDGKGFPRKYPDGRSVKMMTYPAYAFNFQKVANLQVPAVVEVSVGSADRWFSMNKV